MMKWKKKAAALLSAAMLLQLFVVGSAQAVSTTTATIVLYLNSDTAYVNTTQVKLGAPATIINGSTYVPARFLGEALGFKVEWDAVTNTISMEPEDNRIVLDLVQKKVFINGKEGPFDDYAAIVDGNLLVKLTWVADYMGANYTYNGDVGRVRITYVKPPVSGYVDAYSNKPVAKFVTGKPEYRIGEPVKYVDLSYDPDAEGIAQRYWRNREEAFFEPGTYSVTLQVYDYKGNKSAVYTNYVKVTDEVFLSKDEYPLYKKPIGTSFKTKGSKLFGNYHGFPEVAKQVTQLKGRKLLVSDSPENVETEGILYQDVVNGKARLYADHMNMTKKPLEFAILATNDSDKEVTIKTTKRGEVFPSIYAMLIGREASVDFLMGTPEERTLVVPPNSSVVYSQMPTMYPEQGVNLFYDLETDGPVKITFAASHTKIKPETVESTLPRLGYNGNVRGTFDTADIRWDVDLSGLNQPSILTLGDGKSDVYVNGYDVFRKEAVNNYGNYGVKYDIHISNPKPMAILLMGLGGSFAGAFKINGDFALVPESGILPPFEEVQLIGRTDGTEKDLHIEFTPPAGTFFPAELIFYPLDTTK
ncbi:copper amine oxidase N-terminal domain-containing protein [Paenibacillus chartarius]|uniref:Copper amine oxidase N-terminal domain-containing protein n=1 Tax=Paenibacillus chartarius TaxID=747481 RepID=A0ABV6DGT4_9BACL